MQSRAYVALAFLALLGASCGGGSGTAGPQATPSASDTGEVLQNLDFSGRYPGHLPAAQITCAKSAGTFDVNLAGMLRGEKVYLAISVKGYKGAGTYSASQEESGSGFSTFQFGLAQPPTVLGSDSPSLPASLTVDPGQQAGSVDASLAFGAALNDLSERITGDWRCA